MNRRDFLKLAGMLPLGLAAPRFMKALGAPAQSERARNVIVVVFDAWSAFNVSLYGYPRTTTPNIDRLAARAIRYHNHFAGGSFTTPGTASLLTGVLPWTHRAFELNGMVARPYANRHFFSTFRNHYSLAYTHNSWAYTLLRQFGGDIDELIPRERLLLPSANTFITRLFTRDNDTAAVSWERETHLTDDGDAYSLFLSRVIEGIQDKSTEDLKPSFPLGLPTSQTDIGFTLEDARHYIADRLASAPQPFAGYFHFLPPHYPYNTSTEFHNFFDGDGFSPIHKPRDLFATDTTPNLQRDRKLYDEFVLYCDDEFAKFYNALEASGLLENTWLVLTSDHGEMFERDITGHVSKALYEPGVRVPLIVFEPGRAEGMDIHDYTSAIDVLPTLAHVTGETVPEWGEGVILPPFAPTKTIPDRSLHVLRAVDNAKYAPFKVGSFIQVRGGYKLHYYFGYRQTPGDGLVKLYDLRSDPEEMNDLATLKPETTSELLHELKTRLKQADQPYL